MEEETTAVAIDYLQKDNPRSIYSLAPPKLKEAMNRVHQEYLEMSPAQLDKEVRGKSKSIPRALNCLRFRLWDRFGEALDQKEVKQLTINAVVSGICSRQYFDSAVLRNPLITAWLVTPPVSYEEAAREALDLGVTRLREVLEFPLWDDRGRPDVKVAKLHLEVTKMLDARVKGSPTQHHSITQKNLNVNTSAKEVKEILENESMEELEKKLKMLRSEEEKHFIQESKRPKLDEFKSRAIEVESTPLTNRKDGKEF